MVRPKGCVGGKSRLPDSQRGRTDMAQGVSEFTDGNFQSEVLDSALPVLVDFWAPWCGPCRMLAPTIDELATEFSGKVRVGKVNTDDNPQIAIDYQVSAIP